MPRIDDNDTNPNQRTKELKMNTNTTPALDLNTILSAAVLQIVTHATATLTARVDELERVTATQASVLEALLQGLRRVESIVDGSDEAAMHRAGVEQVLERLTIVERTLYGADDATTARMGAPSLMRDVQGAIDDAMKTHEDEFDHDAVDPDEIDRKIRDAIDAHSNEANHPSDDAIESLVYDTLREATIRITV